jgi:putative transposase
MNASASPTIKLAAGSTVVVGRPGQHATRTLIVDRLLPSHGSTPSRWHFHEDVTHQPASYTHAEIAFLARKGEFNVIFDANGAAVSRPLAKMQLDESQQDRASRCLAYVTACLDLGPDFRRSRGALMKSVKHLAKERNERPPGFTTLLTWIDTYEAHHAQHGDACFIQPRKNAAPVQSPMSLAVERGAYTALRMPKGTGEEAFRIAQLWLRENHPSEPSEDDDMPSVRTFQRKMADFDRFLAYDARFGPRRARRRHAINYERRLPDRPLEDVECDHTTFDILLVDPTRMIVYGRPDVITFRDRYSGCVLGLSIGFEAPSYASFLDGLRHAVYPKPKREPGVETEWFCWGRPRRLIVDNGLHFIGHNIANAAANLGIQLAETRPGEPWLKGAQERLFGQLNMVAHNLPGSTLSNIVERKNRKELEKAPILTLDEFRSFIHRYVCDIYHLGQHVGLGMLRTLAGVPKVRWDASAERGELAIPPSEDLFVALAGDWDFRAVNNKGVRWDHIRYGGSDLLSILTNPKHLGGRKNEFGGTEHHGSRYKVMRDPFDLGSIYVINHHDRNAAPIKVPAMRQDYAAGLTLHQHRVHIANASQDLAKSDDPESVLIQAKLDLTEAIIELLGIRKSQDIERKLARFLYAGKKAQMQSVVTAKVVDPDESRDSILPDVVLGSGNTSTSLMPKSGAVAAPLQPRNKNAAPSRRQTVDEPGIGPGSVTPPINDIPAGSPAKGFDLDALEAEMAGEQGWNNT